MTVSHPEVRTRHVQRFPNVSAQATVCLIHIGRNVAGSPTEIEVSPKRPSETCVFYPKRNDEPSSIFPVIEHPREVVWTVNGLRRGESLVIEAKAGIEAVFGREPLTIEFPEQFVASGPVQAMLPMAALPRPYHWEYSITLRTGTSRLVLDPVIIVDEDP